MIALTDLSNIMIAAVVLVIAIGLLLAYVLSSSFSKPIRELMYMMRKAQGGDLTVRLNFSHQDDDFGILGNAFNTMLGTLSIMISRISSNSAKLKDASQQLMNDILDSKESLGGLDKSIGELQMVPGVGQETAEGVLRQNAPLIEEGRDLLEQLETLVDQSSGGNGGQLGQIKLSIEKTRFLFRRLSVTCIDERCSDKSLTSYYSYINKVNSLEVEVEKLKLLMKNINSSAAKLEEIALSLDRQVNNFEITEEEEP